MFRVWRRFAIWLVVLVLPLQGLAANAAMRCLLTPDGAVSTAHATAERPPCHAELADDDLAPLADTAPDAAGPLCPHCVACMALGAAAWPLVSVQPTMGQLPRAEDRLAEPPHHAIAFVTDGPDRPPRTPRP